MWSDSPPPVPTVNPDAFVEDSLNVLTASTAAVQQKLFTTAAAKEALEQVYPLHAVAQDLPSVDWLKKFERILITGPQRSGTTFLAQTLAEMLGLVWLDEFRECSFARKSSFYTDDHGVGLLHPQPLLDTPTNKTLTNITCSGHNRETLSILDARANFVAQRPTVTAQLQNIQADGKLLVIFIARNCLDVFRSQNRINWTCANWGRNYQIEQYAKRPELGPFYDRLDMVCKVKQNVWRKYQQPLLAKRGVHTLTLSHAEFSKLPGYKHKELRKAFGSKDTSR
jgi:hypothetical protein